MTSTEPSISGVSAGSQAPARVMTFAPMRSGEVLKSPGGSRQLIVDAARGELALVGPRVDDVEVLVRGGAGAMFTLQEDGNLVAYLASRPVWSSGTSGFPRSLLVLRDDGSLAIEHRGRPVWTADGRGGAQDRLEPGMFIAASGVLQAGDGRFRLIMQASDGNLVLYDGSSPLWASGPCGSRSVAVMQSDGALTISRGGMSLWTSGTGGFPGAVARLTDRGSFEIAHENRVIWDAESGYVGDRLRSGDTLDSGGFLRSRDARFRSRFESASLIVSGPVVSTWRLGRRAAAGVGVRLDPDGDLVVVDASGTLVGSLGSGGLGCDSLALQDDGNLVLECRGRAVWSSATGRIARGGALADG